MFEAQIRLHCPRVGGRDHDFSAREPVYVISFTPLEPYFGTVLGAFWTRREMILNLLEPQVPLHGPRSRGHDLNFSARELVYVATFAPFHPGTFGSARNRKELQNDTNSGLKLRPDSGP